MSHLNLKWLIFFAAAGALVLMGNAQAAQLYCPDSSAIKVVSIQYLAGEQDQEWKGEQLVDDYSKAKEFEFQGAAIKQGTDSETKLPYHYVICNYGGEGKDDYLRLSQRFVLPPMAKGPGWNENKECKSSNVTDCAFELMNSKGPAKFTLPAQ
ncbi:hypothetical protein BFW86_26795 [Pseudomonas fluorescens]|nr:hypothetical protein BFW86_26795 [Pseudomonas fluorescens]